MDKKQIELLYRSMDSKLTPAEQLVLQRALTASAELRAEKKRIEIVRRQIRTTAVRSFKSFFAERVMKRLTKSGEQDEYQSDFFDSLVFIFRRVLVAAAVIVLLLVSYNVIENHGLSMNSLLGFQDVTLEDVWLPIDTASWENMQ